MGAIEEAQEYLDELAWREALVQYYLDGHTFEECGLMFGCCLNTAKKWVVVAGYLPRRRGMYDRSKLSFGKKD